MEGAEASTLTMAVLFGDDDSEDEAMEDAVPGVKGLFHCKKFLGVEEQNMLLSSIETTYRFDGDAVSDQVIFARTRKS